MKKIILMIVLITMSLQAEMRMAITYNSYFVYNGVKSLAIFSENKVQSYEDFIKKTTKCKKYKVLGISNSKNGSGKILIDCLD